MKILTKKIIHRTLIMILGMFVGGLIFSSCEKDDPSDFVNVAEVASQHLGADFEANYLFSIFHMAIFDTALINNDTSMIDSAMVYRMADASTSAANYTFDYGDSTLSPDYQIKSGIIEAFLDKDFYEEDASFEASFSNFQINGTTLTGTVKYINTGVLVGGKLKLLLEAEIDFYQNQQLIIQYQGNKEILWTDGFAEPENFPVQKFSLNGTASSVYTNSSNTNIPEADLSSEIDEEWIISFSCHKLVKQGHVIINETHNNLTEVITGDLIDVDLDGCIDKVMLKNEQNYGYPVYI